jgi:flavorubredoxin
MQARDVTDSVKWLGAVDWDRRLFDSLIPLPDGTSYNAYLVTGSEKVALLDTVDPPMAHVLMDQLAGVPRVDYVVSHHAEQDHSGTIPQVLERYPEARVVCSAQGQALLADHLGIAAERFMTVADGETLSLGNRTLRFIYTPWVHWPETMVTLLEEEHILFTCDWFGSHVATSDLYAHDEPRVYEAAKRYFAEIMMPFRRIIQRNLDKIAGLDIATIAPSHGPMYHRPAMIVDAYRQWVADAPGGHVVVPFISMHGSTRLMVERLVSRLAAEGVVVDQFDLSVADLGKLAIALVDAGTIVIGTPTFHRGPHPSVFNVTHLANALRPRAAYVSIIGSYGWATNAVEQLAALIPDLRVEIIPPVVIKGRPSDEHLAQVDALADAIVAKHRERGWL